MWYIFFTLDPGLISCPEKTFFLLHACSTCAELPSSVTTTIMHVYIRPLWKLIYKYLMRGKDGKLGLHQHSVTGVYRNLLIDILEVDGNPNLTLFITGSPLVARN